MQHFQFDEEEIQERHDIEADDNNYYLNQNWKSSIKHWFFSENWGLRIRTETADKPPHSSSGNSSVKDELEIIEMEDEV